ncbi:MAG: hypothetical protein WBC71_04535 [Salaquimonas sp.]
MRPDARVILSFDFEIGWGDVTNQRWRMRERNDVYSRLRTVLPEILKCMDDCDFPATWATVGAMFTPRSQRDFSHLPPNARDLVHSVLKEAKSESFDGKDLFESVIYSRADHLIASHSYSHVPFTYQNVTNDTIHEDMLRFNKALAEYNLKADRFVFPENREAHFAALAKSGYRKARVAADNRFSNRYLYLASTMFLAPPSGREEIGPEGIVRQFGSMLFNDAGKSHRVPLLNRRLHLGLRQLERNGGVLHIWAHPFNFAESDPLKNAFIEMIKLIAKKRDKGLLTIELM